MSTASNNQQGATVDLSDAEWKAKLNDKQYRILRHKDTEFPGTGEYNKHFETGVYKCAGCENDLYEYDE
jgi:peptide-methionine (R)-S-oxide reductase